jgi:hypothetical protein
MHRLARSALAMLLAFPMTPLRAQGEWLTPGARVRVWPTCAAPADSESNQACLPVVGRLVKTEATGVLIQREGRAPEAFPRDSSTRLEVSGGSRHHTLLGLGIGTAVGFGAGMVLAGRAGCGSGIFDDDICGAYGIAIPAGAALGAVVGRLIRSERWRPIATSSARLRLVPSGDRLSLSLGLAF